MGTMPSWCDRTHARDSIQPRLVDATHSPPWLLDLGDFSFSFSFCL